MINMTPKTQVSLSYKQNDQQEIIFTVDIERLCAESKLFNNMLTFNTNIAQQEENNKSVISISYLNEVCPNCCTEYLKNIFEYINNPEKAYNINDNNKKNDVYITFDKTRASEEILLQLPYYHLFPLEKYYEYYEIIDFLCINNLQIILTKNLLRIAKNTKQFIISKFTIYIPETVVLNDEEKLTDIINNQVQNALDTYNSRLKAFAKNIIIKDFKNIQYITEANNLRKTFLKYIKTNDLMQKVINTNGYIELIDYRHKNVYFNLFKICNNILYNEPYNNINLLPITNLKPIDHKKGNVIIKPEQFKDILEEYTFGLLKHIPFHENNYIFSGGSLYDVLTHNYDQESLNNFVGLDIFVLSDAKKNDTITKIITSLKLDNKECYVTMKDTEVYIFIIGIPRMIQLIFTNQTNPEKVINSFDCSHMKSYYDNKKVYMSGDCIDGLRNGCSHLYEVYNVNRIYKILHKGLNVSDHLSDIKIVNQDNNRKLYYPKSIDYLELIQHPEVIDYLEKCKPINVKDLDNLCVLYKFEKDKIYHVSVETEVTSVDDLVKVIFDDNLKKLMILDVCNIDTLEYTEKILKNNMDNNINITKKNYIINMLSYCKIRLVGTPVATQVKLSETILTLRIQKTQEVKKFMKSLSKLEDKLLSFNNVKFSKKEALNVNIIKEYIVSENNMDYYTLRINFKNYINNINDTKLCKNIFTKTDRIVVDCIYCAEVDYRICCDGYYPLYNNNLFPHGYMKKQPDIKYTFELVDNNDIVYDFDTTK